MQGMSLFPGKHTTSVGPWGAHGWLLRFPWESVDVCAFDVFTRPASGPGTGWCICGCVPTPRSAPPSSHRSPDPTGCAAASEREREREREEQEVNHTVIHHWSLDTHPPTHTRMRTHAQTHTHTRSVPVSDWPPADEQGGTFCVRRRLVKIWWVGPVDNAIGQQTANYLY